jgi:hypothetical protein
VNFRPELAEKVMAGEKTVTRRLVSNNQRSPWYVARCGLKVDHTYAVCPGRGKNAIGRVRVVSAELVPLADLDEDEARREGFESAAAFFAGLDAINGKPISREEWVWRVEFRLVHANDLALWEAAA